MKHPGLAIWVFAAQLTGWLVLSGCQAPPVEPRLHADRSSERIPAIIAEASAGEDADFAALVAALDADDPAVRLYAARALEQTTGETFDYRYYQEAAQRRPAVARWEQWLAEHQGQAEAVPEPVSEPTHKPPASADTPTPAGAESP